MMRYLQRRMGGTRDYVLGVLILAGGESRRMGYPKLLLPWKHGSIAEHLIGQWLDLGAAQVAVALADTNLALRHELLGLGMTASAMIPLQHTERGMFHTLTSAANWARWKPGLTHFALVLGDQPHVNEKTLHKLIEFSRANPDSICQPSRQGRPKHPVLLPTAVFAELRGSAGPTLREFLATQAPVNLCEMDDPALDFDLDYPEDYYRARQLAGCRGSLRPPLLTRELDFPDPRHADAEGLVAIGGDLSVPRLLAAYRSGIYPWSVSPITWWSPDPRGIFEMDGLRIPKSLARVLKRHPFEIRMDTAFQEVMIACAEPGRGRGESTWISAEFIEAYTELHRQGHAHSVECWRGGRLVGGIYGVAVGGLFAGESMFHRESDASKVALAHLHGHLKSRGFVLFDIQMVTPATRNFGARELARANYLKQLRQAVEVNCRW